MVSLYGRGADMNNAATFFSTFANVNSKKMAALGGGGPLAMKSKLRVLEVLTQN